MVKSFNFKHNIEDDFYQFCNLLSVPDVIDYSQFSLISRILTSVITMDENVYSVINDFFSKAFFDCISSFLYHIKQEYNGSEEDIDYDTKLQHLDQYSETIGKKFCNL